MTPGLFDLPAPLLQWVDERLTAVIPAGMSIAIWAVVGGILCLELYRVVSPQQRINRLKQQTSEAQERLSTYDGELDGAWPLMKNLLSLAFKRVGIVLPATLLGAYPVLVLLVWLSNSYGHYFPGPDRQVDIEIAAPLEARWRDRDDTGQRRIEVLQPDGGTVLEVPVSAPVSTLHKRAWWNWLMANPAGYLPPDAPIDEVRIDLPKLTFFSVGPEWLRGWEAIFIPVLFIAALGYKSARHIH